MGNISIFGNPKIDNQLQLFLNSDINQVKIEAQETDLAKIQEASIGRLIISLKSYKYVESIQPAKLGELFSEKREHITLLIQSCINILYTFAYKDDYKQSKSNKVMKNDDVKLACGSIYLLIRLIAFIMKDSDLCDDILWRDEVEMDGRNTSSYIIKLIESIMILLFKPGFTIRNLNFISIRNQLVYDFDDNSMWSWGLGTLGEVKNKITDTQYFKHRFYLLKLMLITMTQQLYQPRSLQGQQIDPVMTMFTNKKNKNLKNLVFSILNSVIMYDCDGLKIPFANTYQKNPYVDEFLKTSLEVLMALTTYNPPIDIQTVIQQNAKMARVQEYFSNSDVNQADVVQDIDQEGQLADQLNSDARVIANMKINEVSRLVQAILGYNNAKIISEGMFKLLKNYVRSHRASLPKSYYIIPFYKELTLLIWRLLSVNDGKNFRDMCKIKIGLKENETFTMILSKYYLITGTCQEFVIGMDKESKFDTSLKLSLPNVAGGLNGIGKTQSGLTESSSSQQAKQIQIHQKLINLKALINLFKGFINIFAYNDQSNIDFLFAFSKKMEIFFQLQNKFNLETTKNDESELLPIVIASNLQKQSSPIKFEVAQVNMDHFDNNHHIDDQSMRDSSLSQNNNLFIQSQKRILLESENQLRQEANNNEELKVVDYTQEDDEIKQDDKGQDKEMRIRNLAIDHIATHLTMGGDDADEEQYKSKTQVNQSQNVTFIQSYNEQAAVQTLTLIAKEIEKRLVIYFDPERSIKNNFEIQTQFKDESMQNLEKINDLDKDSFSTIMTNFSLRGSVFKNGTPPIQPQYLKSSFQFESWLNQVIWARISVNHSPNSQLFDSEKIRLFSLINIDI
ncbi:UNKNOWN [Stylonychia lemnae]|uniref:Uncharacterized protein n=1 Tax=Stylonychia lemnae TaxID=5949 RepID=A0A078A9G2_STYLE|nr:UNKNOWN [Stylonychia lemnae]|eukprot:CDW78854.1 UNKNOWN [Stylonychia lemnae]